jgi:DNA-binding CsgD family transcriptional regulator
MSKSQRIRLRDIRSVYRLIGECRDLSADARQWYTHAMDGLRRLVGAQVVTTGETQGWSTGRPYAPLILDLGWSGEAERYRWQQWFEECELESDLVLARLCRLGRVNVTRYRRQLVSDREWYTSLNYNEYRRISRVDDCLLASYFFPDGDGNLAFSLHRPPGDPAFGEWERRLVHWFLHELGPLVGPTLRSMREPPACELPPRLQQTLECLLDGDSEKQVALRLGLSRQTVHDYVKALYRRFGVCSRAELLSRYLRPPFPAPGSSRDGQRRPSD